MMAFELSLLQFVEVVWTQFFVGLLGLEHMIDHDQQRMNGGNQGL